LPRITAVLVPYSEKVMKIVYAVLAILGAVLPLSAFVPWAVANGFDPRLFFEELFANRVSAFFGLDVIIAAVVVIFFAHAEARRARLRRPWIPVVATLLVGVSFGLPLLLLMRDEEPRQREARLV
jgi:hypothetical protein